MSDKMNEKEYSKMIYKKADAVKTKDDLNNLIDEITSYNHDYGTIIYGCMGAMKAAFKVVNNGPQGGITGFQAGCLGWECVHEFLMIKPPCKILDYNNMLYPQYEDKFDRTIDMDTWEYIQKKANEEIASSENSAMSERVKEHWHTIKAGKIPFGYQIREDK